ncbi:hypothetical protein LTR64_007890 [Lithohypha guttulata]|uniref:AB hydrolase-1 domain-containing protein n=1 Tax=Lithohypha guttulata TaxID=1690604 RepID=A0AAN7SZY5_9EURO|nr:hypothetical protein LTR51_008242 [Lithohypha guttulata]KAK5084788.1 hypothetical protein LTR05_005867 [Lithohypha guttulata]
MAILNQLSNGVLLAAHHPRQSYADKSRLFQLFRINILYSFLNYLVMELVHLPKTTRGLELLVPWLKSNKDSPRNVIAVGHDRGGRIVHRLAVSKSNFPQINLLGAAMFDIVPTKAQWDEFKNPAICQGYFHWPLLANVDSAVQMISKYGGGQWARDAHKRISGGEADLQTISKDGALDVYAACFEKEETLRYSCEDYAYGAAPEYQDQKADQEAGRKVDVPSLIMWSKAKLGARIDVAGTWKEWIAPGADHTAIGVGDGHGHYLPEEASKEVIEATTNFIKKLTK